MKIKDRVVVFPDIHFPHHSEKALKCALKIIKEVEPTAYLNLGDIAEGESVSHWKWKRRRRPPLEYQLPEICKEIEEINMHWDRIDEALDKVNCKNKVFAQGNHELWFDHFVEENPFLSEIKTERAFRIKERGYKYYPYGKIFKVFGSKLNAYHGGHYSGINHTRAHVLNLGCNIIYGHTHDCQRTVVTHLSGPHMAHSMGCLTDMDKEYLKKRKTNWTHNVGIVDIFDDRNFTLHVLDIYAGKTSYNGKLIIG